MRRILTSLFCSLIFLLLPLSTLATVPDNDIPEQLRPWIPWVLHDHEKQQFCTSSADGTKHFCLWPEPLVIKASGEGAMFSQRWTMQKSGWIFLPGTEKIWPHKVTSNGETALVINRKGRPALYVAEAGEYHIAGHFSWKHIPESLEIAPGTGIVQLTVNGSDRLAELSGTTLWLSRSKKQQARVEDTVHLQVYRLITDAIPMLITSQLKVQVSGVPREIVLDWQPPAEQIPVSLQCNLPVKIGSDGKIHLQARPGTHTVIYRSRLKEEVTSLTLADTPQGPPSEYWSFEARNQLRMVKISGAPVAVDPSQTTIPEKWHRFPAYRVQKGQSLNFTTLKRGNPEPPPNHLTLHRIFWLDEDGAGMTVQEQLQGTVHSTPRLTIQPPAKLGRMVVNGRDQLITRLHENDPAGVEVRQGQINAMAVSRIEEIGALPAGGWNQSISKLSAELVLPPGWTVFHASGIDKARTWITRWTLLDCFIVLIIVISSFKLLGPLAGLTALAALLLSYHDAEAPIFTWLALLGCTAIIRALPDSKYCRLVKGIKLTVFITLILGILPYSVSQLRVGFFPQLGWGDSSYSSPATDQMTYSAQRKVAMPLSKVAGSGKRIVAQEMLESTDKEKQQPSQMQFDTNAKVQSGPGVPARKWRTVHLGWNGPVEKELTMQFILVSPLLNLILAVVKVAAIFLLTFFMLDLRKGGNILFFQLPGTRKTAVAATLFAVMVAAGTTPQTSYASYPSEEMLNELEKRLLEPHRCAPNCADIAEMRLDLQETNCSVVLTTMALADCAIQVPSGKGVFWRTASVDGMAAPLVVRNRTFWMPIPEGQHQVTLEGRVNRATVDFELIHKPHKVLFSGHEQWTIQGLDANLVPQGRLQCTRREKHQEQSGFAATTLPPLMQVERTLNLGLEWTVETVITRMSPTGSAVFLKIPLLEGESVINPEFQVEKNMVAVSFAANERRKSYRSLFKKQETLSLLAPATTKYYETWRLNASPVWHIESEGIAPILHHGSGDSWQPEWQPWPKEQISLTITRPQGVPGPTKTIDSSILTINPGLRSTTMHLSLRIRSTRGNQQHITLPEDAIVQRVQVNGIEQPIKKEHSILVPLTPGIQQIEIAWRTSQGITSVFTVPQIDVGNESVNADITINVGNRWIWFVKGPQMGPAILFYSEILIILLVAILLGRSQLTPLRSIHWLLLGFGLCQSGLIPCLIIVVWFLALKLRKEKGHLLTRASFNASQFLLILLTLVATGALAFALQNGLLGHPDMLISGNNSNSAVLHWYQARITETALPQPTVVSIPIMAYRVTMLLWALWMAFYLLRWVKWGWNCFTSERVWEKITWKKRSKKKSENV